jgi:hypothetical protein
MENKSLDELAEEAITAVFSDRSVSQIETNDRLNELIGFIRTMQDTLELN